MCVVCGSLVACSKKPKDNAPAAAATASVAAVAERHPTAPEPQNPRDFGAMFANEASSRPAGPVKTEDVLDAFRKEGIQLDTVRQHLARPYGARYCVGAMVGTAIALSVCEYVDPQAATDGRASALKIPLANREVQINTATTLTVREVEKTPDADAVVKRLFATFARVK